MNYLVYSKAQLRLQAGNRFMVLPEPKAARVLPAARPAFNLRFAKNTFAKKFKSAENTIQPRPAKFRHLFKGACQGKEGRLEVTGQG